MDKKDKPKLEYYTIEVDVLIPAKIKYKILAESPEKALEKLSISTPIEKPNLILKSMKKLHAKVFKFGTFMLMCSKKL